MKKETYRTLLDVIDVIDVIALIMFIILVLISEVLFPYLIISILFCW